MNTADQNEQAPTPRTESEFERIAASLNAGHFSFSEGLDQARRFARTLERELATWKSRAESCAIELNAEKTISGGRLAAFNVEQARATRAEAELAAVKAQDTGMRVRYAKDADYFRVECSNLRASNAALRAALEKAREYIKGVNEDCPAGTDDDRDNMVEELSAALAKEDGR